MNKIIIWKILLFILLAIILYFVLKGRSPFGNENSSFSIDQKKEPTRIEFSDGDRKLSLEKKGESWLVNGKNETRKSSVLFIMRVLKEIKIKSPVSPELFNTEITEKRITPVKVRVYEQNRLLKSFLVYKTGSNPYGNIMKIRERSKPFVVYVPGYEGDIGSAFILNELFWQPFTLFNLLPSEIASVSLENFSDPSSSFSIISNNYRFAVTDMTSELSGWDSSLVKRYLSYFTWIPFEAWAFDISRDEKQKIESEQPFIRITVTGANSKKSILTLWEREKEENGTKTKDSDRLWGKTENSDELFIMRYFDVDPILKKRSYFFPE